MIWNFISRSLPSEKPYLIASYKIIISFLHIDHEKKYNWVATLKNLKTGTTSSVLASTWFQRLLVKVPVFNLAMVLPDIQIYSKRNSHSIFKFKHRKKRWHFNRTIHKRRLLLWHCSCAIAFKSNRLIKRGSGFSQLLVIFIFRKKPTKLSGE